MTFSRIWALKNALTMWASSSGIQFTLTLFSDAFYIQFFQAAFPDVDFSQLEEAENEEEMAENIQSLIDLLGD